MDSEEEGEDGEKEEVDSGVSTPGVAEGELGTDRGRGCPVRGCTRPWWAEAEDNGHVDNDHVRRRNTLCPYTTDYCSYNLLYSIRRLSSQIHEFDIAGKLFRTVILYCLVLICFDIHSDYLFAEHSVNF